MTIRRAPRAGYDFGAKRQYRREVWRFLATHCPVPRSQAQALLLPSSEGDEIEVALNVGFREPNLHIVDRNAAIVATLKRRYPLIHTYGVAVARAALRIKSGSIHVANLDLCSNISPSWFMSAYAVGRGMAHGGVLAATYLKGRDPIVSGTIRRSKDDHCGRIDCEGPLVCSRSAIEDDDRASIASDLLGLARAPFRRGEYQSHVSPMAWVAGVTELPDPRETACAHTYICDMMRRETALEVVGLRTEQLWPNDAVGIRLRDYLRSATLGQRIFECD